MIRDVYSGCSGPVDSEFPPPSSSPVHKAELEKVRGVDFPRVVALQEELSLRKVVRMFSENFSACS